MLATQATLSYAVLITQGNGLFTDSGKRGWVTSEREVEAERAEYSPTLAIYCCNKTVYNPHFSYLQVAFNIVKHPYAQHSHPCVSACNSPFRLLYIGFGGVYLYFC